jgi:hypothetical protein
MANALCKAFQFGHATVFGLDRPAIQVCVSTLRQHQDKSLTELVGGLEITVSLADLFDLSALLLIKLCRLAHLQKGRLGWETGGA